MDLLHSAMSELLAGSMAHETLRVPPQQAKLRSQLYASGFIEGEHIDEQGYFELRVKLPRTDLDRILKQSGTGIISHDIAVQERLERVTVEKAKIA